MASQDLIYRNLIATPSTVHIVGRVGKSAFFTSESAEEYSAFSTSPHFVAMSSPIKGKRRNAICGPCGKDLSGRGRENQAMRLEMVWYMKR